VESGWVVLYEVVDGVFRLTDASESMAKKGGRLRPLAEYLAPQERFRGISPDRVKQMQARVEKRWRRFMERGGYVPQVGR